jgi:hypothetical protein
MERVTPILWTMFGFAMASAIFLPKPSAGGFSGFCAVFIFVFAVISEIHSRRPR